MSRFFRVGVSIAAASILAYGVYACDSGNSNNAADSGAKKSDASAPGTDGASGVDGSANANDSGNTTDGASGPVDSGITPIDASFDAGPPPLGGCATFTDNTGLATVDIPWDFNIEVAANHCSKVSAGTVVRWTGDFVTHPLDAFGGDTPNPVAHAGLVIDDDAGVTSISVTFANTGAYGYHCMVHAFMVGAIQVVP